MTEPQTAKATERALRLAGYMFFTGAFVSFVGSIIADALWQVDSWQAMTIAMLLMVCGVILLTGAYLLRGIRLLMEEAGLRVSEPTTETVEALAEPAAIHRG